MGRTPELECPPILRACADPPETADLQEKCFCGAAIQYQRASKQLPNCPPIRSILLILSYLELKVYLEREIEREEREVHLVKGLHLVKRSIPRKESAGGGSPRTPRLSRKVKLEWSLKDFEIGRLDLNL